MRNTDVMHVYRGLVRIWDCRGALLRVLGFAVLSFGMFGTLAFGQQDAGTTAGAQSTANAPSGPQITTVPAPSLPLDPAKRRLRCRRTTDPHRRRFGCKDEPYSWDETLLNDWDGARRTLKKFGIDFSGSYYAAPQTNLTGGKQKWGYIGNLTTAVNIDFSETLGLHGTSLYLSDIWVTGSNLNATVNSVFALNSNYAPPTAYAAEMYLQQKMLHNKLTLAAGRLAPNYTFASLPVLANYVNFGFNPTPGNLVNNDYAFGGPPPGIQWGAQAVYDATPEFQISGGVFNNNPNSENNGNIFAFQQGNKGALIVGQVSYLRNQSSHSKGKEGEFTAGFYIDNNSFPVLPNKTTTTDSNYTIFALAQQLIYRPDGPGTHRGLTVWADWGYTTRELVSSQPLFAGSGISYQGLIPVRKQDILSAGWIYGRPSKFLAGFTPTNVFEANYEWNPTKFIAFTPDLQYVWNPAGSKSPNATVFGVQLKVTF